MELDNPAITVTDKLDLKGNCITRVSTTVGGEVFWKEFKNVKRNRAIRYFLLDLARACRHLSEKKKAMRLMTVSELEAWAKTAVGYLVVPCVNQLVSWELPNKISFEEGMGYTAAPIHRVDGAWRPNEREAFMLKVEA